MSGPEDSAVKLRSLLIYSSRCWADECVLFDELSGDTHLLPASAFELLKRVEREGVVPLSALTGEQGDAGSGSAPEADRTDVGRLVDELARLQLIDIQR
jgi:PqqD family protein of HPr-rel-A system